LTATSSRSSRMAGSTVAKDHNAILAA
jgi:hypothetical protein